MPFPEFINQTESRYFNVSLAKLPGSTFTRLFCYPTSININTQLEMDIQTEIHHLDPHLQSKWAISIKEVSGYQFDKQMSVIENQNKILDTVMTG